MGKVLIGAEEEIRMWAIEKAIALAQAGKIKAEKVAGVAIIFYNWIVDKKD